MPPQKIQCSSLLTLTGLSLSKKPWKGRERSLFVKILTRATALIGDCSHCEAGPVWVVESPAHGVMSSYRPCLVQTWEANPSIWNERCPCCFSFCKVIGFSHEVEIKGALWKSEVIPKCPCTCVCILALTFSHDREKKHLDSQDISCRPFLMKVSTVDCISLSILLDSFVGNSLSLCGVVLWKV